MINFWQVFLPPFSLLIRRVNVHSPANVAALGVVSGVNNSAR